MTVFVNARFAFSQEAPESGTSVDANWDSTGPTIDEDAASADKVLEIPQAKCDNDGTSAPCDAPAASGDDDNDQAINAPSPGSPPQVYDDDTASSGAPDEDWGTADEYQNQQVYAVPYGAYPYPVRRNRSADDEPTLSRSCVRVRSDEQPADAGRATVAESGAVDDSAYDVRIQPAGGQSDDGDGEFAVRVPSLSTNVGSPAVSFTTSLRAIICARSRRYRRRPSDGDF